MKTNIIKYIFIPLIIFSFQACKDDSNNNSNNNNSNNGNNPNNPLSINISTPEKRNYYVGDIITISAAFEKLTEKDTVSLSVNGENIAFLTKQKPDYKFETKNSKTGKNNFTVKAEINNKRFSLSKSVILYSDISPINYSYKIINTYKHDRAAYTQGLFYHNGSFYEATGLKGESTVRKVVPETGEVLQSFAIPKTVFGEGICMFENNIVQVSWQAQQGFVYDLETFKLKDNFTYNGDGWGITTDGEKLFMSNGSEIISIIDPQTYSQIETIEVYDNEGKVVYLNELEYINGEIYANIYQYEKIVRIDPKTGKVLGYIELKGILPMNDYLGSTDVLNGIAYDAETERLFVTGKKWPKLFEIELIKK